MNAFPFEVIEGGAKPALPQGLRDRLPKGATFPYYWANIDDDEQMTPSGRSSDANAFLCGPISRPREASPIRSAPE